MSGVCYSCKEMKDTIVGKMEFFGEHDEIVRADVCAECRVLAERAVAIANWRGPVIERDGLYFKV